MSAADLSNAEEWTAWVTRNRRLELVDMPSVLEPAESIEPPESVEVFEISPEPEPVKPGSYTPREGVRAHTVSIKRLSKRALARSAAEYPPEINAEFPRPRTWSECLSLELGTDSNPCPYVSCKQHLYLDVNPETGSIKFNFPDREPWEITETCSLRVADRGGETLERVGELLNITRERVRQLEGRSLAKLQRALPADVARDLRDLATEEPRAELTAHESFSRPFANRTWKDR